MKVALITLEGGGISTVCHGLARSLSKRKVHTTVFTAPYMKHEVKKVNEFLDVHHLPCFGVPPGAVWFQIQNFRFLSKALRDYTIVHGVSPDASAIFTFYRKKIRRPVIASFHAVPLSTAKSYLNAPISSWTLAEVAHHILEYPLHDFALRRCIADADHIITCSLTTRNEFRSIYKDLSLEKTSVIYNALDFGEIEDVEAPCDNENEQSCPSIIFAGRLFWLKGPMYLLKAFEILREDLEEVNLKLFGNGPEENRMKEYISETGLENSVHLYRRVPHKRLLAEIKNSDAVVLPSLYEAQSMFALEAMACKKPLICFDIPAAREIIADGHTGFLAKAFDVKDLAEKIKMVLLDRNMGSKVGQNAYLYARREHNWDNQVEKYLSIYDRVI